MKYFLASLLFLTIFFGCNSDKTNTAGGITSPVTSNTNYTDTISFNCNGDNYDDYTFRNKGYTQLYELNLTTDSTANLIAVDSTDNAITQISLPNNDILYKVNINDLRTYAITLDVFDNLVLEYLPD